jgi:hypothetical protein
MAKLDVLTDRAGTMLEDNRDGLKEMIASIRDLAKRSDALLAGMQEGRGVIGQLLVDQDLAEDLNATAINLSLAAELIVEHPESLVFGNSLQGLAAINARRDRMRMRRAFNEGFHHAPRVTVEEAKAAEEAEKAKKKGK